MKVIESNCNTGEVSERNMTPEEIKQVEEAYAKWLEEETSKKDINNGTV